MQTDLQKKCDALMIAIDYHLPTLEGMLNAAFSEFKYSNCGATAYARLELFMYTFQQLKQIKK